MQLAQINIAEMKAPINDPIMADFVANLEKINTIAESSEGFIWRLKGDEANATAMTVFDNIFLIINMSVWKDKQSLFNYVYTSAHADILKRKKEWFQQFPRMHMALWYVADGHEPTPEEAKERLYYLQEYGESPFAFSFKNSYTPKDALTYQQKN